MTKLQRQLIEFHRAFDHPIVDCPTVPADERVRLRASLVVEECLEFVESLFDPHTFVISGSVKARDALQEARRLLKILVEKADVTVDLVGAADAMADIDYVVEGSRLEFGINGEPIADEVHRSNMAKAVPCAACVGYGIRQKNDHDSERCQVCGSKGRILLKNAEGKTMKPAGWTPPDIKGQLAGQRAWKNWALGGLLEDLACEPVPATSAAVCDHSVTFDEEAARTEKLDAFQVRARWPRLFGECPKGCGFNGIAYASTAHFVYGDW